MASLLALRGADEKVGGRGPAPGLPRAAAVRAGTGAGRDRAGASGDAGAGPRDGPGVEVPDGPHAVSAMAESWWPIGPPRAIVLRRWLKKRASSASVSCGVTSTVTPAAASRAAQ